MLDGTLEPRFGSVFPNQNRQKRVTGCRATVGCPHDGWASRVSLGYQDGDDVDLILEPFHKNV